MKQLFGSHLRALGLWALAMLALSFAAQAQDLSPPLAAVQPKDVSVHGERRIDDYFWLREQSNPAVLAHLQAEAAYTARWFEPLAGLKSQLYEEMLGRIQQADEAAPVREGRSGTRRARWPARSTRSTSAARRRVRRARWTPARPSSSCWT